MFADVNEIIGDESHSVTIGGVTKPCTLMEGEDVSQLLARAGGAEQITVHAVVMVSTADYPAVKGKDAVVVNTLNPNTGAVISSRNFTVWRRQRIHEGAVTELLLRAA